jgi:hypothetical protein
VKTRRKVEIYQKGDAIHGRTPAKSGALQNAIAVECRRPSIHNATAYSRNDGFSLSWVDAVGKVDAPAVGVIVDPHGDFGFDRRVLDGIRQDKEVGA